MFFFALKLYFYSFAIITVSGTSKPWKRMTLVSVTTFPGLEQLFRETNFKNDPLRIDYDMDIAIKRGICFNVLNSSYFKMIKEEWVDPQLNETRRELNAHYLEIYTEFYGKPRRKRDSFRRLHRKDRKERKEQVRYSYSNEYKERSITLTDGTLEERVFTCLAREEKEKIKEYFISKEYNINKANTVSWEREYITGRFVFSYNAAKNKVVLHALAEDAALFHTAYNHPEMLYVARRQRLNSLYKTKENDPICQMSDADKLRTCSAILSIAKLRSKFKFRPKMNSIESECVEKELVFETERIEKQLSHRNTVYKEWTIACVAEKIEGKIEHKIYISRCYHANKVFVYSLTVEGRILIEFIASNLAVIDDDFQSSY